MRRNKSKDYNLQYLLALTYIEYIKSQGASIEKRLNVCDFTHSLIDAQLPDDTEHREMLDVVGALLIDMMNNYVPILDDRQFNTPLEANYNKSLKFCMRSLLRIVDEESLINKKIIDEINAVVGE